MGSTQKLTFANSCKGGFNMSNQNTFYYFQVIVYSEEKLNILRDNFISFCSPLHNARARPLILFNGSNLPTIKGKVPHWHLLIRYPNKVAYSTFINALNNIFNGDLTDIKFYEQDTCVKHPEMCIRYYYHIDFKKKEQFQLDFIHADIYPEFLPFICKAFNNELLIYLNDAVNNGLISNCNELIALSPVFSYWYSIGNHSYLIHNILTEALNIKLLERKLQC